MPQRSEISGTSFRTILRRNVALPLIVGVATALVFVGLVLYLLNANSWTEHSERVIANTEEIGRLIWEKEASVQGFLASGDESYLKRFDVARPVLLAQADELAELVADNPPQAERMRRLKALQSQWDRRAQELIAARRTSDKAMTPDNGGIASPERDESTRLLDAFLTVEQTLRVDRIAAGKRLTTVTIAVSLATSLLLSLFAAWRGRKELVELSAVYDRSLTEHEKQAAELQHQAWLRSGQIELTERVVGQNALLQLAPTVLEFLANYLGAAVAVLYVRGANGKLERKGGYGFDTATAPIALQLPTDESLIGRAIGGRRPVRITGVPPDYWKVSSALGAAAPAALAIVPVHADGKVNGVIELGFMEPPHASTDGFLELIAPAIGGLVEAAQQRERLQSVLEETQQLNEELQTQQEELRTANEELEQQASALAQSRASLSNQKAELQQTNDQLEAQARALDDRNIALTQAREQLEQRASDLERASQYKSEFLANMSHELRTPLNSALILSRLLADNKAGTLNVQQVQYAETIYSAGNDLLNLINDILDLAKVEAGKIDLHIENVNPRQLDQTLGRVFEPMARDKQLAFDMTVAADVPPVIATDARRLEQVLKNLLSNAIKFTERGGVSVAWTMHNPYEVRCTVTDTGIGIAPEHRQRIFEAFQQADGTTSRQFGGTGLGLSISRSFAALLGGDLTVESEVAHGSAFVLSLPVLHETAPAPVPLLRTQAMAAAGQQPPAIEPPALAAPAASAASRASAAPAKPQPDTEAASTHIIDDDRDHLAGADRIVLVVEDEPRYAAILYEIAQEMQYKCVVCGNGAEALLLAAQLRPHAILLDLGLPDRSGLLVLQELKSDPATRHIPVHVVSATDRTETALHLGAVGYAVKPSSHEELTGIFRQLEEKSRREVKRVLLVEDDARQRDAIVSLISDAGVEIVAVERGDEAIARLGGEIFDCMIVDLKLPDMQGGELLERMARTEGCSFPPVIVYTGRSLTRDEERELLRYSQTIIIKGARSPERLLDEVTLFLHQVESTLSQDQQRMLQAVRARDRMLDDRRVLLVDDDARNVFSLTSALEMQGMRVEIGRNGFDALELLETTPDIDVVLMDVMMPGMDGLEAMRRIRANPKYRNLPVIAITAKAMQNDQRECLDAGFSDYIAKPVNIDKLYSLLRVWVPTGKF